MSDTTPQSTIWLSKLGITLSEIADGNQCVQNHELSLNEQRQLKAIAKSLSIDNIDLFLEQYDHNPQSNIKDKNIAIVMAGNLPLVGFMDIIYVLLSGNNPICKLSSKDDQLLPKIVEAASLSNVSIVDELPTDIDAIIATGSDNTARHFDYHYRSLPRIIRKSRTSVAILTGNESPHDLELLADDILSYSGLGCRNVSKLLLPLNYALNPLINAIINYPNPLLDKNYSDSYKYNTALFTTIRRQYINTGISLIYEASQLGTPVATTTYSYYNTIDQTTQYIVENSDKIQCVVASLPNAIPFGQAQTPMLSDYADNIDIIRWIKTIFN